MEKLTLYVGTTCPFCKKVESFMEDKGIDSVEIKNIDEDKEAREYLIEKGGKKQVPCLFIGCLLYTSPSPRDQRGSRMPSSA